MVETKQYIDFTVYPLTVSDEMIYNKVTQKSNIAGTLEKEDTK